MATLNQLKSDLQQSELFKDVADVLSASSSFAYKDIFDNFQNDLIETKFYLDRLAEIKNRGSILFPVISLDLKEGIWGYPKGCRMHLTEDEAEKLKPTINGDSLVIAIGSNSGFCSNYNKDIMNGYELIKKENCRIDPKLLTIGKQIRKFNKTEDDNYIPDFPETKKAKDHAKLHEKLSYVKPPEDIQDKDKAHAAKEKRIQKLGFVSNLPLKKPDGSHYEYIILLFTDRHSKEINSLEDFYQKVPKDAAEKKPLNTEARPYAYFFKNDIESFEYDFNQVYIPDRIIIEPNSDPQTNRNSTELVKETLNKIRYRIIRSYIYYALFTSEMSENEARMKAMTQASDNIKENIDLLKRQFQRKRQELITKELIEIISGAEALKRAKGGK